MKIEITDRLRPFSHTPGHSVMIPGTHYSLKAFPVALYIYDKEGKETELLLSLKGPIDPFTVEQDLSAKLVRIYGDSLEGYFRLAFKVEDKNLRLFFEKTPAAGISIGERVFLSGDFLEIAQNIQVSDPFQEKLFLGSSKQKDMDLIRLRKDLREVFPLWYHLGAITPERETTSCLKLEEAILKKDKKEIEALFYHTYLAHFSKGLVPRKEDTDKQGLSPLMTFSENLLFHGFTSIRSLFFQEKEDGFYLLPCLLPSFVCGKLIQVRSKNGCVFDLEWTKGRLRRVCIHVEKDQEINLHLPKDIESFRLKTFFKDRGKVISSKEAKFPAKAGSLLWLDLFQK